MMKESKLDVPTLHHSNEIKISTMQNMHLVSIHNENLHSSKLHNLAIKTQKTTHIQLLCNYPLGITTSVQLPPYKYNILINKLSYHKII